MPNIIGWILGSSSLFLKNPLLIQLLMLKSTLKSDNFIVCFLPFFSSHYRAGILRHRWARRERKQQMQMRMMSVEAKIRKAKRERKGRRARKGKRKSKRNVPTQCSTFRQFVDNRQFQASTLKLKTANCFSIKKK